MEEHAQALKPFQEVNSLTAIENQERGSMARGHCEELPTCYIEEVPYEELVSQGAITEGEHQEDIGAKDKGDVDVALEEATKIETKVTLGEGDETPAPPSTRSMHEQIGVPPPFLHPTHLELVFELRGQMADQEHRILLMRQHMDMLFDA